MLLPPFLGEVIGTGKGAHIQAWSKEREESSSQQEAGQGRLAANRKWEQELVLEIWKQQCGALDQLLHVQKGQSRVQQSTPHQKGTGLDGIQDKPL
jgi:hypothetical protein